MLPSASASCTTLLVVLLPRERAIAYPQPNGQLVALRSTHHPAFCAVSSEPIAPMNRNALPPTVTVLLTLPIVVVPVKIASPDTDSFLNGDVVPTPTFPPAVARYVVPVVVSWVVEAPALNCWSALQEFAVVVPNASETALVARTKGYVNVRGFS